MRGVGRTFSSPRRAAALPWPPRPSAPGSFPSPLGPFLSSASPRPPAPPSPSAPPESETKRPRLPRASSGSRSPCRRSLASGPPALAGQGSPSREKSPSRSCSSSSSQPGPAGACPAARGNRNWHPTAEAEAGGLSEGPASRWSERRAACRRWSQAPFLALQTLRRPSSSS